jgi:hypothetical protein
VVSSARQTLGDRHELTLIARANQVLILRSPGKLSEAETVGREICAIAGRAHGELAP